MKTPISILERLLATVARLVKRAGMACGEPYMKTPSRFIDAKHAASIRERLDAVYESDPESSRIDPLIIRLQIQSLPEDDW
jgi:hypothetical protein